MSDLPSPRSVAPAHVLQALRQGWSIYLKSFAVSAGFAAVFVVIGIMLMLGVVSLGLAPLIWALAGGFLLVGPVVLAGFFGISAAVRQGRQAGWGDVLQGFRHAPGGLIGLSAACVFLFVIWMVDATILYSFMVGNPEAGWQMFLPVTTDLLRFQLGAWLMGSVFALIVFCISAYSVPLMIERRAPLVRAVSASVRAVFSNLASSLLWALLLGGVVISAIVLPPVLIVILPVLAYAGEALYRAVFPEQD